MPAHNNKKSTKLLFEAAHRLLNDAFVIFYKTLQFVFNLIFNNIDKTTDILYYGCKYIFFTED